MMLASPNQGSTLWPPGFYARTHDLGADGIGEGSDRFTPQVRDIQGRHQGNVAVKFDERKEV